VIFPHLLVCKQNIWYVYAFCTTRREFRLFKIGRIRSAIRTGETFERIPFRKENILLAFWNKDGEDVSAKFEVSPEALPFAEEWLGVSNVYEANGKYYAEAVLPDDESLAGKILSAGAGFRVLSPDSLKERIANEAKKLAALYPENI